MSLTKQENEACSSYDFQIIKYHLLALSSVVATGALLSLVTMGAVGLAILCSLNLPLGIMVASITVPFLISLAVLAIKLPFDAFRYCDHQIDQIKQEQYQLRLA